MNLLRTGFGWIETDSERFEHDIVVFPDGSVANRYDHLHGDNHLFAVGEARTVLKGTKATIVVGTGQTGLMRIPPETGRYLADLGVKLQAVRTPQAVELFRRLSGPRCGVFHVTC